MLINLVHQDSGQNLSSVQLDVPKLAANEPLLVAQMANNAFEKSGLKSRGFKWCRVQQQKNNGVFLDADFDDTVQHDGSYRILVTERQKPKEPEDVPANAQVQNEDVEIMEVTESGEPITTSSTRQMPKFSSSNKTNRPQPMEISISSQTSSSTQNQQIVPSPTVSMALQQIPSQSASPSAGQISTSAVAQSPELQEKQSFLLQYDLNAIMQKQLNKKALGSNAHVGNLYNVKTDTIIGNHKFLNDNIGNAFMGKVVEKAVCRIADMDMEGRFRQLDIDAQQKISILAQMSEVSGYGLFVQPEDILSTDFGSTEETCGFTIVQRLETKKITLNLRDPKVVSFVLEKAKSTTGFDNATHLLHSCTYGMMFCCVVTYDADVDQKQAAKLNLERIHRIIHKYVSDDHKTKADWDYLKSVESYFKVQLFASQKLLSELFGRLGHQITLIQLIEGIKTKNLKSLCTTNFIGHPLSYEMVPLDQLVQPELLSMENKVTNCDPTMFANNLLQMDTTMKELVKAIEDYKRARKQYSWFRSFEYCFREYAITRIMEISDHLRDKFIDLNNNCRHLIKTIRDSRHEECAIAMDDVEISFKEFYRILASLSEAMAAEETNLINGRSLIEMGVSYVGRQNTTLEDELKSVEDDCYVLFFGHPEDPSFLDNTQLFGKLADDGQKCIFVNTELAGKPNDIPDGTRIVKYRSGKIEFPDYLTEHCRKLNTCIIRIVNGKKFTKAIKPPEALIPLNIPCPKSIVKNNCSCPDEDLHWECDGCHQLVQYDRSMKLNENPSERNPSSFGYFYCGCGKAPANQFTYRCKSTQTHGEKFTKFTFAALTTFLKQFCIRNDSVNVLLLSETGVGKSTWINSLVNYLTFETLEDAEKDGPAHIIPAKFMKGTQNITIGDVDITKRTGQSDTQETKCHVIPYKGQEFKIFDTPGVCDTAGIGKDELNFKNIMWTISNYNHLNGIIILMKPNSARLTIAFKYCINELLKHLHKDAAKNILFCFTNSSGTNYEQGDTIPALQELLQEVRTEHKVNIELNDQTAYYVDNEAFRYLCELKNNIQPSERAKMRAKESWEMTVPVIRKMLNYIQTLPPHNVVETVSLNDARRIIVTLAQPLARITQIIQMNINLATIKQNEMGSLDANSADLEKVLLTHQQRYVERKQLNHPRTVCTAPSCTTVEIDEFGESTTVYSKHCHPHCYLDNVRKEARADPGLRQCSAMHSDRTGKICCKECGCVWDVHMHIYYELLEKTRTVESAAVKDMLKNNIDKKQIIEKAMAEANMRIQKNKEEQDRINEIAARFGSYLKRNGIVSYNKYIEEYMEMQIQNAQLEAQYTGNRKKIELLENALNCYLEQRAIIERFLDTGKETIHPADIKKYLHQLFNLELNGALIKELFDAEEMSRKQRAACAENAFVPTTKPQPSRNLRYDPIYTSQHGGTQHNQQQAGGRYNLRSGNQPSAGGSFFTRQQSLTSYDDDFMDQTPSSSSNFGGRGNNSNFSRQQPSRASYTFGEMVGKVKKYFF